MAQKDYNKSKAYVQDNYSYCQECGKPIESNKLLKKLCVVGKGKMILYVCPSCC